MAPRDHDPGCGSPQPETTPAALSRADTSLRVCASDVSTAVTQGRSIDVVVFT